MTRLPDADTLVAYPDGATASTGTVVLAVDLPAGRTGVVLDRTAFHPVDSAWPDQPADRGALHTAAGALPVVDAVVGAVRDGELFVGADVPVRTGAEGWAFVVVHVVAGAAPAVGEKVRVEADAAYRGALSAGHTACHLASLALDAALADAWSKPVPADALGSPAFDALAIQSSRIGEHASTDVYRIGRSLRRKGFAADALDDLDGIERRANALLAEWTATDAAVRIDRDDEALSARRRWVCALPGGSAEIPCGGTHLTRLGEVAGIVVALSAETVEGGIELTMRTTATPVG